MGIYLIAAVDRGGHIGWKGKIPWDLPSDRKHFRELTMGHVVVMGRKTFQSIGRPLEGRTNVVLTRNRNFSPEGCITLHSPEEVLERFKGEEVFVIGGGEVFRAFIPVAERIYLTRIDHDFKGDTTFPLIDPSLWKEKERKEGKVDGENPYPHTFITYIRKT